MPSRSPRTTGHAHTLLTALGDELRARRKSLQISATAAAERAGISRVTLHRIEQGNPSVTIGAYFNVAAALGLQLTAIEHAAPSNQDQRVDRIRIGDYPQLLSIAWQLNPDTELPEESVLQLYERNWRHVDHTAMNDTEQRLVERLVATWGHGTLLV